MNLTCFDKAASWPMPFPMCNVLGFPGFGDLKNSLKSQENPGIPTRYRQMKIKCCKFAFACDVCYTTPVDDTESSKNFESIHTKRTVK